MYPIDQHKSTREPQGINCVRFVVFYLSVSTATVLQCHSVSWCFCLSLAGARWQQVDGVLVPHGWHHSLSPLRKPPPAASA